MSKLHSLNWADGEARLGCWLWLGHHEQLFPPSCAAENGGFYFDDFYVRYRNFYVRYRNERGVSFISKYPRKNGNFLYNNNTVKEKVVWSWISKMSPQRKQPTSLPTGCDTKTKNVGEAIQKSQSVLF